MTRTVNGTGHIEAKIKRAEYEFDEPAWKDISPSAKELISQLMTLDVEKRLTAEECFEDHEHRHDRSGAPEWLRDDTEAMDCPRFRRLISSSNPDRDISRRPHPPLLRQHAQVRAAPPPQGRRRRRHRDEAHGLVAPHGPLRERLGDADLGGRDPGGDHYRSRSRGGARGGDGVRRCPPACGPTQIPPFPARSALR